VSGRVLALRRRHCLVVMNHANGNLMSNGFAGWFSLAGHKAAGCGLISWAVRKLFASQ
jgi:hypothetical protein